MAAPSFSANYSYTNEQSRFLDTRRLNYVGLLYLSNERSRWDLEREEIGLLILE